MEQDNSTFIHDDKIFEYTIERRANRKRTISILIDRRNGVVVRAPSHTSYKFLEDIIKEKASWIAGKLQSIESRGIIQPKKFITGEQFHYLGRDYELLVVKSLNGLRGVCLEDAQIVVRIRCNNFQEADSEYIKKELIKWYKQQAQIVIGELIDKHAFVNGLLPDQFKIKNLKSSWGNCNRNNLSFNWRLVLAPVELIEYVVVHELCHIKQKNHSKDYWQLVESVLPDCKQRRKALQEIGATLCI